MNIVFQAHSGFRWLILLLVVVVIIKSLVGLISKGRYSKFDKILGSATVGIIDLQFLLGLILYFFYSPFTKSFSFDMSNAEERFWSVEHLAMMFLAIAAAHVGKVKATKSSQDSSKFRFQLIFFAISLALMIMSIPWDRVGG